MIYYSLAGVVVVMIVW